MILLLLWLAVVFVATNCTLIGLVAAVAKRGRRKPFALILFITTSKPHLCLLVIVPVSSYLRPFHGFLQSLQPTSVTSFLIFFSLSLPMLCLLISLLFTAIAQSVQLLDRSCRARVRIPVRGSGFLFSKTSILSLGPIQRSIEWVSGIFRDGKAETDHSFPTSAHVKHKWS